jgi:membrane fusion protein, multidrug efflux system
MNEVAPSSLPMAEGHHSLAAPELQTQAIRPLPTSVVVMLCLGALLLLGGVFMLGWLPHAREQALAATLAKRNSNEAPLVHVIAPTRAEASVDLVLPGEVRATQATSVFARTSGYLSSLAKGIDIGAHVKASQLLAEISAPELKADLARVRADLQLAEAAQQRARDDLAFQQASFARYKGFADEGGLTSQQLDDRRQELANATTGVASAEAGVAAAQAAQQRLEELVAYTHVVAPFEGVITYRGYDQGAMIAATDLAAGKELFRIVDSSSIRVRVAVPQAMAASVHVGQEAQLVLSDAGNATFAGKVARSALAVDAATRTMTIEVDVPNPAGTIMPGTYGQVHLHLERSNVGWRIPASALMVGGDGTQIALVIDGKVHLRTITIERDLGTTVEVTNDFVGDERIVENPGVRLADGVAITVRNRGSGTENVR